MDSANRNNLDTATQARLRKLRDLPVDTSALRAALDAEMDRQAERLNISFWRRPLVRVAAALLLIVVPLAVLSISSLPREAVASPEQFAALHQQVQAHSGMLTPVSNMDAAERALKAQWAAAPDMPEGIPHEQMACCVHKVAGKQAAVVALRSGEQPITMAVVDAKQVGVPRKGMTIYNGREYAVSIAAGVRMVMFERGGKSVCIMGDASQEELLKLADAAKF